MRHSSAAARVGLVLKSMHQRDAELLILRAEGLTHAELSNALSIKAASVGVMLSRAESAFRKEYLKRYGLSAFVCFIAGPFVEHCEFLILPFLYLRSVRHHA